MCTRFPPSNKSKSFVHAHDSHNFRCQSNCCQKPSFIHHIANAYQSLGQCTKWIQQWRNSVVNEASLMHSIDMIKFRQQIEWATLIPSRGNAVRQRLIQQTDHAEMSVLEMLSFKEPGSIPKMGYHTSNRERNNKNNNNAANVTAWYIAFNEQQKRYVHAFHNIPCPLFFRSINGLCVCVLYNIFHPTIFLWSLLLTQLNKHCMNLIFHVRAEWNWRCAHYSQCCRL